MTAVSLYNHAAKKLANKEVNLNDLKVMLLNGAAFDATHTNVTSVSGSEVSGNGWTAGGELLTGVAVTIITTNDAMLDANNLSVVASGGTIGPATAAVIYDDLSAGNDLLMYIDFEGSLSAPVGTPFSFTWSANGLIRFVY